MALTKINLLALINNTIFKNGRKAVTGDKLNKVLTEVVEYAEPIELVNIYNANDSLTGNRTISQAGFFLVLQNGKIGFVETSGSCDANSKVTVNTTETIGTKSTGAIYGIQGVATGGGIGVFGFCESNIGGQFEGGNMGVGAYSYSGKALYSESTNLALETKGRVMHQQYGASESILDCAILQVNSRTKGVLLTRMSQFEIDSISSPVAALEVFNEDRGRKEVYNGSYYGSYTPMAIYVQCTGFTASTGSNWFFGNQPVFPTTVEANRRFTVSTKGVIRKVALKAIATGTAGTRSLSLYIRINGTTDYLVATVASSSAIRDFINDSLNIPIIETDTISFLIVAAATGTDSTNVIIGGNVYIQ